MSIAHILFFFSCKRRIALKNTVSFLFSILWVLQKNPIFPRTCLKKHFRNLRSILQYILPEFGCRSPLWCPHSGKISHKLWRTSCRKPFSNTLKEQKSYTLIFCLNTDFTVRKNGLCISLSKIHKINTWKWWTVLLSDWRK